MIRLTFQSELFDRLVRKSQSATVWFLCGGEFHSHEGMSQLQVNRDELLVAPSVNDSRCFDSSAVGAHCQHTSLPQY
jgi:hypothetical protein